MSDALIVFVKEPRPGAVKTRLARAIGDAAAADVYRALAEAEIRNTAPRLDASSRPEYDRLFFFAPAGARDAVEAWLTDACVLETTAAFVPQSGGDLGERMARAFSEAFAGGARRVVIIGTDVPACSRAHVLAALRALDDHDLAVGPTRDGGYYLLALDRPRPELFRDVAWSTPAVLPTTLERAASVGLRVQKLEPLEDVDTPDDLQRVGLPLPPRR